MRFLGALLFSLALAAVAAAGPSKAAKPTAPIKAMNIKTRVVKKDSATAFDEELSALLERLARQKDPAQRYADFAEVSTKLAKLVNLGPRPSSEEKALEMALVIETFEGLPARKDFDPARCGSYVEETELRMGNRSGSEEEDPGVVKGLKVLKAVCGS